MNIEGLEFLKPNGAEPKMPGVSDYDELAGDRSFALARLLWLPRRIAAAFGPARAVPAGRDDGSFPSSLPIESVAGMAGPDGRRRPLPFPRRKLRGAWRRAWLVRDLDELPAVPVRRLGVAWVTEDDPAALVTLEVLRAKGVRTIRVRRR